MFKRMLVLCHGECPRYRRMPPITENAIRTENAPLTKNVIRMENAPVTENSTPTENAFITDNATLTHNAPPLPRT